MKSNASVMSADIESEHNYISNPMLDPQIVGERRPSVFSKLRDMKSELSSSDDQSSVLYSQSNSRSDNNTIKASSIFSNPLVGRFL